MIDIEKEYGPSLSELFKNGQGVSSIIKRGFATVKEVQKGGILFIGINPSYKETNAGDEYLDPYYTLENARSHPYFRRFDEIAKYAEVNWSHIDLLTVRETNQKKIEELIDTPAGKSFVWEHLLLSKRILEKCKPEVIVVANTAARRFLGKDANKNGQNQWLGYTFSFDFKIGTDRVMNEDSQLFGIPVFFTSMLTGQRAMDKGSFERLQWHIDFVIKNNRRWASNHSSSFQEEKTADFKFNEIEVGDRVTFSVQLHSFPMKINGLEFESMDDLPPELRCALDQDWSQVSGWVQKILPDNELLVDVRGSVPGAETLFVREEDLVKHIPVNREDLG